MFHAVYPHGEVFYSYFGVTTWFLRIEDTAEAEAEAEANIETEAEPEASEDDFDEGTLRLEGVEVWFRVQLHGG